MKKSINKLSLNKMTISNLDDASMSQKVGGVSALACLTKKNCSLNTCPKTWCGCPIVVK